MRGSGADKDNEWETGRVGEGEMVGWRDSEMR